MKLGLAYRPLQETILDIKIILSDVPNKTKKQVIYGYVEFKSADYFSSSGSIDGKEILPRKRQRANMRIYFNSTYPES